MQQAHWLCSSVFECYLMLIGNYQKRQSIFLLEVHYRAGYSSSVRYLRNKNDPTLSWNLHISNVVSTVCYRVASILCFGSLSPEILCALYTDFVLLSQSSWAWLRISVNSKFTKKLPPSCASKLVFTSTECGHFYAAIHVFRSIHKHSLSYLQNIFQYSTGFCGRNIHRIFVPRVTTNHGWKSVFFCGTVLWNSLSAAVVEAAMLSSFIIKYWYFIKYCNCLCCLFFVCICLAEGPDTIKNVVQDSEFHKILCKNSDSKARFKNCDFISNNSYIAIDLN